MSAENLDDKVMAETVQAQTDEEKSKDIFFERIASLADEMISKHGKDFTMGAFVLAARFIAEGRPLSRDETEKKH